MKNVISGVLIFLFLLYCAVVGYLLLTKPRAVAEYMTNKGIEIMFLDLARTKWGRVQVRFVGLVLLITVLIIACIIFVTPSPR
jgi:hypothetical protein